MLTKTSFKKIYLKIFSLIFLCLFHFQCGGLVTLDIPLEAYQNANALWLQPQKNILRHNSVNSDVFPPYRILWKKKYKSVITDNPLAVDKFLIFTVQSGMLALIDIEQGKLLGDGHLVPGMLHSALLHKNILYYSASLGEETIGALDITTLKHIWKKKLPHLNTTPTLWNDILFAGANNGKFYALDVVSGKILWEFDTKAPIFGNPSVYQDHVFLTNVKGILFCLDAKNGTKIWKKKLSENIYAGPLVAEDKIIIGSTSGILYAITVENGTIEWQLNTRGSIYSNAAYREGIIYCGNNAHKMLALDIYNGKIIWEFQTEGINNSTPLVGPELLYFGSWDKNFYVLNNKTGELIHKQEFPRPIKSSPIIYRNRIFIHAANERLYCMTNEQFALKEGQKK